MPLPPRPPVNDPTAIVDYIRHRGSVEYPIEAVPADFTLWRRQLRTEARRTGIRISDRRHEDLGVVLVYDPDYRPTNEQLRAVMEAVASLDTDEPIDYETALKRQRRRRLRVVPDPD